MKIDLLAAACCGFRSAGAGAAAQQRAAAVVAVVDLDRVARRVHRLQAAAPQLQARSRASNRQQRWKRRCRPKASAPDGGRGAQGQAARRGAPGSASRPSRPSSSRAQQELAAAAAADPVATRPVYPAADQREARSDLAAGDAAARGANVMVESGARWPRHRLDVTNEVLAALNQQLPSVQRRRCGSSSSASAGPVNEDATRRRHRPARCPAGDGGAAASLPDAAGRPGRADRPRRSITAIKAVTINEGFFQGHFPGRPIMPGVLIVEALAQAAGVLAVESLGLAGQRQAGLFHGDRGREVPHPGRARRPAPARGRVRPEAGDRLQVRRAASVDGKLAAEANFTAMIADPPQRLIAQPAVAASIRKSSKRSLADPSGRRALRPSAACRRDQQARGRSGAAAVEVVQRDQHRLAGLGSAFKISISRSTQ